jgi:uncharacterized protein YjhX (UPF0386 family)
MNWRGWHGQRAKRRRKIKSQGGYPYVWTRSQMPPGRKGQRCRKLGKRGPGGTVAVQFSDGGLYRVAEGGLKRADG